MTSFDPVAYLARRILVDGQVLRHAHRHGVVDAVRVFAEVHGWSGGCGIDNDGVWRLHDVRGRNVRLRLDSVDAQPITVDARALIEWALARLTPADHARLDELADDFHTAVRLRTDGHDGRLWFRNTYTPSELTDAERAQIRDSWARQHAASRATRDLLTDRLAADHPATEPGGQLDLFAELASGGAA